MSEHPSEPITMLEIKNQHSGSAPTIEINHGDYVSYWMNPAREQLVFVRRKGEDQATLDRSDGGWSRSCSRLPCRHGRSTVASSSSSG